MAIRVTERSILLTGSSAFPSTRRATMSNGSARTWASTVSASPTRNWRRRPCRPEWPASRSGLRKRPRGFVYQENLEAPLRDGTLFHAWALWVGAHHKWRDHNLDKTLISLLSGASALALLGG